MEAGQQFNITPYGTETMHLLRAEKGFIIVGQDTDGTMTPIDLQMNWIVSKKKYDFIGKRSLYRSDTMREDRKQLVGLLTDDPNIVLEEGAQIVSELNQSPVEMLGHVTSSYFSPNLKTDVKVNVNCDETNGKFAIVVNNIPKSVAQAFDNKFDDGDLTKGKATYDETNKKLTIVVTTNDIEPITCYSSS
jgi:hypothetical protein